MTFIYGEKMGNLMYYRYVIAKNTNE